MMTHWVGGARIAKLCIDNMGGLTKAGHTNSQRFGRWKTCKGRTSLRVHFFQQTIGRQDWLEHVEVLRPVKALDLNPGGF